MIHYLKQNEKENIFFRLNLIFINKNILDQYFDLIKKDHTEKNSYHNLDIMENYESKEK